MTEIDIWKLDHISAGQFYQAGAEFSVCVFRRNLRQSVSSFVYCNISRWMLQRQLKWFNSHRKICIQWHSTQLRNNIYELTLKPTDEGSADGALVEQRLSALALIFSGQDGHTSTKIFKHSSLRICNVFLADSANNLRDAQNLSAEDQTRNACKIQSQKVTRGSCGSSNKQKLCLKPKEKTMYNIGCVWGEDSSPLFSKLHSEEKKKKTRIYFETVRQYRNQREIFQDEWGLKQTKKKPCV